MAIATVVAIVLVITACGASDETGSENEKTEADETIELTYATYTSESHYMGQIDQLMFEKLEEETNGQVKIKGYYDGTLIEPSDWYQELLNGSADITQGNVGTEKDRFPLQYASAMFNYGITDLNILLEFTRELEKEVSEIREEYSEVVPISHLSAGQAWIHTNNKPVRSVEDFKGLNLKVSDDASVALAKALGANPMQVPIAETYTALERGTIDGVITGADPLKTFNFAEVTKYSTRLPYATPWIYSKFINKEVFNSLPEDVQKKILDNGKWWEEQLIAQIIDEENAGLEMAKEYGNEIIELSPEETEKLLEIMEENALQTAEDLDSKGLIGTELFNVSRQIADELIRD